MLSPNDLEKRVVVPVLKSLGPKLYTPAAVELLMGTALQESGLRHLQQLGNGPARGLWQMEPATHDDIWDNFLLFPKQASFVVAIKKWTANAGDPTELFGNLNYQVCMTRMHYYRVSAPLPAAGDLHGQAAYWKKHYNTILGAGSEEEYIENWEAAYHEV